MSVLHATKGADIGGELFVGNLTPLLLNRQARAAAYCSSFGGPLSDMICRSTRQVTDRIHSTQRKSIGKERRTPPLTQPFARFLISIFAQNLKKQPSKTRLDVFWKFGASTCGGAERAPRDWPDTWKGQNKTPWGRV